MKLKKVRIKSTTNKPYVALFRRDNGDLHLILNQDVDTGEDSEMSYDEDQYELVRAPTLQEMLTGGKKINKAQLEKLKETSNGVWDDAWDEL
jgi:hypothetical protein